ncbi:hypothetical protein GE21DRAFT_727 [Neurospora crassa]|nr:hypothetical protein GE21DRAFT_727 [Neurospora crassa]
MPGAGHVYAPWCRVADVLKFWGTLQSTPAYPNILAPCVSLCSDIFFIISISSRPGISRIVVRTDCGWACSIIPEYYHLFPPEGTFHVPLRNMRFLVSSGCRMSNLVQRPSRPLWLNGRLSSCTRGAQVHLNANLTERKLAISSSYNIGTHAGHALRGFAI